jgi:hypothetical protein
VWGLTFLVIAFTISRAPEPGWVAVAMIGICFVAVMVSGLVDTHAERRGRAAKDRGDTDAGSKGS